MRKIPPAVADISIRNDIPFNIREPLFAIVSATWSRRAAVAAAAAKVMHSHALTAVAKVYTDTARTCASVYRNHDMTLFACLVGLWYGCARIISV